MTDTVGFFFFFPATVTVLILQMKKLMQGDSNMFKAVQLARNYPKV